MEIDWQRIATDLQTTTGVELTLTIKADPQQECWPDGAVWLEVDVRLDGRLCGSMGRGFPVSDDEEALAYLADLLREDFLDEAVWGGWPICPLHNTHPLEPMTNGDGVATWQCPAGTMIARIGDLGRGS